MQASQETCTRRRKKTKQEGRQKAKASRVAVVVAVVVDVLVAVVVNVVMGELLLVAMEFKAAEEVEVQKVVSVRSRIAQRPRARV